MGWALATCIIAATCRDVTDARHVTRWRRLPHLACGQQTSSLSAGPWRGYVCRRWCEWGNSRKSSVGYSWCQFDSVGCPWPCWRRLGPSVGPPARSRSSVGSYGVGCTPSPTTPAPFHRVVGLDARVGEGARDGGKHTCSERGVGVTEVSTSVGCCVTVEIPVDGEKCPGWSNCQVTRTNPRVVSCTT